MTVNIRIVGEAGQGLQSMGNLLAKALGRLGIHIFTSQTFLSRVRGGLNTFDLRLSDSRLYGPDDDADILVTLTDEALGIYRSGLSKSGMIIHHREEKGSAENIEANENVVVLDLIALANEAGGKPQMANTVAAGAIFSVLGYDISVIKETIRKVFKKFSEEILNINEMCAESGYVYMKDHRERVKGPAGGDATDIIMGGSDIMGLSAARCGVKLACSYPMTPSTGVFTYLAQNDEKYGIVVEQAEDEIAALNIVCGAVYAGVPAMTTTSGGGFALMVEALSLAGVMELPVVIFLSQRPGPATGLPTRTEQADLNFAIHCSHGEFPRAIFAPGTSLQAYDLMRRTFETAHKFQTPAILMGDHFLTNTQTNVPEFEDKGFIERHIEKNPGDDYVRYAFTDDGISPRIAPGGKTPLVADSHEHKEDGHMNEDAELRVKMQDKRMKKFEGMIAEYDGPELYPANAIEAKLTLVCWGSTYGPCREAVDVLREKGTSVRMVHFSQVWPLDVSKIKPLFENTLAVPAEGNNMAQFASVLRMKGIQCGEENAILRYDGFPLSAKYILGRIKDEWYA